MGKYKNLQDDIFSVFASADWLAESVKTFHRDSEVSGAGTTFIRVSILSGGDGINKNSTSGLLIAEIFTPANSGPSATADIADKLDKYLTKTQLSTVTNKYTQFGISSMVPNGIDKHNPSLVKSTYTTPFNHFGVS